MGLDINTTVAGSTTEVTPDVDYDVVAEGLDIWNTADSFHFSHETVTGDFDQVVHITAFVGSDIGGKAGLMVRESLNANSRNVLMAATRADGYRFSRRSTIGGTTLNVFKGGTVTYPNVWVRLRRQGNVFTGFTSTDGSTWTQRGQITLSLPATRSSSVSRPTPGAPPTRRPSTTAPSGRPARRRRRTASWASTSTRPSGAARRR